MNILRYRLDATIRGDIEYDPSKPESFTAALETVAAKRKGLAELGAEVTHDAAGPVKVRAVPILNVAGKK